MRTLLLSIAILTASLLFAQDKEQVQVYGSVTDVLTGKPVYECLVEHYDMAGKRWSVTTVNSEGLYSLFIPAGEPFELRVTRENGYQELCQRNKAVRKGSKTFELPLKLTPKP
ncbi:MAG: hypothetical protein QM724_11990 [Flavobacteriales bacterium]